MLDKCPGMQALGSGARGCQHSESVTLGSQAGIPAPDIPSIWVSTTVLAASQEPVILQDLATAMTDLLH